MTATTSSIGTRGGQGIIRFARRLAQATGSLVTGIGARWNAFVDAGQLGPDSEQSISRHSGARI